MPNAAVSQANATLLAERQIQADRKATLIEDVLNLFTKNTAYVRQDGGYGAGGVRMLTAWSISGVKIADGVRNLDASGALWVRVTANGGNWDIHVYKAVGAASEVMNATNVAAGATATLAQANSSGLSGSCLLSASVMAAIAADTYRLQVYLGYPEYDRQIFDGSQQEDGRIQNDQGAINKSIGAALLSLITQLNRSGESQNQLLQIGRIWQLPGNLDYLDKTPTNNEDVVTVQTDGVLPRENQNWKDNTIVQSVAPQTFAAGAVSYASGNVGQGVLTVGAVGSNIKAGRIDVVCSQDTLPSQRFIVTFTPADGTSPIVGANPLTISASWTDPEIPVTLSLVPTYVTTGATTQIASVANITAITGVTADFSNAGILYVKVVASGGGFIFQFYADSGYTLLVAQSPIVAANTAFMATEQNHSGITVGWKSGSAPTDGSLFNVNIQPFTKGSPTLPADSMSFTLSQTAAGRIQDMMRRYHDYKFYDGGSTTIPDTLLDKGGVFIDGAR
jgi:hypothetical protein